MSGGDTTRSGTRHTSSAALSAADRQQYEEHLARCRACHSAVAQIAGMPGLLAQVPAHEVLAMGPFEDEEVLLAQPPASLMPALPLRASGPGAALARPCRRRSRGPGDRRSRRVRAVERGRADPAPTDGHDRCGPCGSRSRPSRRPP